MTKKHIYYVEALIEVPVVLKIAAVDEQEAFSRTIDGAWHGVQSTDYDKSKVKAVGKFTLGPGLN